MKFKKTKNGNLIVPIIKGHLAIPQTNKKYELSGNYEVELTRKDFEKIRGNWKDIFKKLYNNNLARVDFSIITSGLADVIYKKFKEEEPKLFKETDLINICLIHALKDYPKKGEVTFNVSLDLLKEYSKK